MWFSLSPPAGVFIEKCLAVWRPIFLLEFTQPDIWPWCFGLAVLVDKMFRSKLFEMRQGSLLLGNWYLDRQLLEILTIERLIESS